MWNVFQDNSKDTRMTSMTLMWYLQGLIQKEKVDIDGEKSAQISIVAKKTVTQRWLQIMIMEPKQATHYNYFVVF